MTRIHAENHQIQISMTNKVALNSFDDKRFILSDGITTLPHGHFWLEQNRAVDDDKESFVNDGDDTSSSSSSSDEDNGSAGGESHDSSDGLSEISLNGRSLLNSSHLEDLGKHVYGKCANFFLKKAKFCNRVFIFPRLIRYLCSVILEPPDPASINSSGVIRREAEVVISFILMNWGAV